MPQNVRLSDADRPAGMMATNWIVPIIIALDSGGHATGCTVMQTSGSDAWDAAGCRIAVARARFTVPRDAFGRAAPGAYDAVIDWAKLTIHPAR